MDYSKAQPGFYKNTKYKSKCERYWFCFFDVIGAIAGYEKSKRIGKWKPDILIHKFPGLILDKPMHAEIKSVQEVLHPQYREYALEANPYGITILLFGHFPTFIDDNDILDTMPFNIATVLDLKTKSIANLRLGINIRKENIFGLISDNPKVIQTTGEYQYITNPYRYEALQLLVRDVKQIEKFNHLKQIQYEFRIRKGHDAIKSVLLSLEDDGAKKWIKRMDRLENFKVKVDYRDIKHETIITNKYSDDLLNNGFAEFEKHAPEIRAEKDKDNDNKQKSNKKGIDLVNEYFEMLSF